MRIGVYCSAKDSISEEYLKIGDTLGEWIGSQGHALVFGGATGGLMSRVSNATKVNGGHVIGVIPPRIVQMGRKAECCDELIDVGDMAERKRVMREQAECFVCLPGGYGTLDEMFDVIASGTVGEHRKPIYIVNYKGFYELLKAQTDKMKEQNFIPEQEHYKPIFVNSIEEVIDEINTLKKTGEIKQ